MSDEIKEIKINTLGQLLDFVETEEKAKVLIDYITNLQQAFENSYTEEQLDFAVNEVKEQLKAEHQLTNQLHNEIDKLRVKNYELQQENERLKKLEYKFFYCSEDEESFTLEDYLELGNKLYDVEQENERLKEELERFHNLLNSQAYKDLDDYKSKVYKIEEYIEEHITADSNDDGDMWYTLCNNTSLDDFIINIRNFLQGGKNE